MAIVQELNESWFMDRFKEMGRENQFSYEALQALYEYYDEYSEEIDGDYKLDVIAICCDWYEASEEELINEYNIDVEDESSVIEYMNGKTYTITLSNGNILYQAF